MKKYFLSIVALAVMLFATSCQESLVEPQVDGTTTFTVQVPGQMGTKATPYYGNVDKLYVQVYPENVSEALLFQPEVVDIVDGFFTVSISLIQDQKYDIIFWAQDEEAQYNVADLRKVGIAIHHNSEKGAAFFAYLNDFVPTGTSQPVTLKRPFAQLNLGTTEASLEPNSGKVFLSQSKVKVSNVATEFNTVTGMGQEPVVYETDLLDVPQSTITVNNVPYQYISMDYLPIVGDDQALVTVAAEIKLTNDQVISHEFTNVPVRENYRTNIVGNLISSTTDFKVEIDDKFEEDYSKTDDIISNDYYVVDNVGQAESKFGAGETHIAINHIKNGESLDIPNNSQETLYLQLPDVNAEFTVNVLHQNVKKLNITVPNTDESNVGLDLIVNAPNSTVEIKDSQLNTINGTTAQNTLILNGVTVNEVVVEQGNVVVENDSAVGGIAPGEGVDDASKITIYVDDSSADDTAVDDRFTVIEEEEGNIEFITSAAKLQQLAKLVNGGNNFAGKTITLVADIDLNNVEWTPIGTEDNYFAGTFEGNEHTIKNLTVVETEAKEGKAFIGFFGYAKNATIQNLTFENVYLNIACLDIDHSQGHIGAVAGSLEGTSTIENVTVKGDIKVEATVTANGASRVAVVAGGNSYGNVTMKNVRVEANEYSYLKANNNVGALAGQLQGKAVFIDCYSNIDVTGTKFFAGGLIGIAAGDHTFTNCRTEGDVTITAGREGRANDQYRVGGIAGGWADGKTKVCTLTECSYTGTVSGKNADGSVAEPLDYAGYVGRGYTLANCAGSKVIVNGVEYVQASNNVYGIYIVNGIYEIATPAALKWLADEVNSGNNYFEGKTIKLTNDIDLNNVEWTPIGSFTLDHGFMGNFDGNGYTIKNLKITDTELTPDTDNNVYAGLFGVTEGSQAKENYIKDLVIENVNISTEGDIVSAAIAYPYYTVVENIKVQGDINITGGDYVAGVLGYTRRCYKAKDLMVVGNENSIIKGRYTVGGVIADIQTQDQKPVEYLNFAASGLRIEATQMHVGGISGIISGQTLDGATVKNVTIISDDARKGIVSGALGAESTIKNINYQNVSGAENIVGATYDDANDVIAKGDVYKGVTYAEVSSADKLVEALEASNNVVFKNDIKIDPASMSNAYGTTGINVKNGQAINGGGHTLNIKGAGGTWDSGINTTGGLIKNITVTGSYRGIFINHNSTYSERVVLENVTITGTVYTISCDQGVNQGLTATNSTFNGWTSYAATLGDAKFTNCSFGEGNGYKFCRPYAPTTFVGCDFCEGYTVDPVAAVTFENCTINGVALTAGNISTLVTSTEKVTIK